MKRYHILLVLLNELFVLTQPETFHELPVLPFLIRHMQVQVLMLVVKVALLVLSVASSDISDSFNADKTSGGKYNYSWLHACLVIKIDPKCIISSLICMYK